MNTFSYHDPMYENEKEAMRLLHLIVAEFTTDPMSVQCFDLRIVEQSKRVIERQKQWERTGKLPPLLTSGRLKGDG